MFVHGMSGAVGHALVVLCQLQGAHVYGTASERKHAAIRELGAIPFSYSNKRWIQEMKALGGVHVVFDPLGFQSWDESYFILSPDGGTMVGYGGNLQTLNDQPSRSMLWPTLKLLSRNLLVWTRKKTKFYYISRDNKHFKSDVEALFSLVQEQKIQVRIKRIFSLDDVPDVHREWTSLTGMGSVLINVA